MLGKKKFLKNLDTVTGELLDQAHYSQYLGLL